MLTREEMQLPLKSRGRLHLLVIVCVVLSLSLATSLVLGQSGNAEVSRTRNLQWFGLEKSDADLTRTRNLENFGMLTTNADLVRSRNFQYFELLPNNVDVTRGRNLESFGLVPNDVHVTRPKNLNFFALPASWTFIVYMDGDNNLEDAAIADFNEMEAATSNPNVNVIVQFDRSPVYDYSNGNWTVTRRYQVTHDTDTQIIHSVLLQDLGEENMGDPKVLIDFAKWAIHNYPADKYALVLWDHGSGWRVTQGMKPFKSVCYDETSGDSLTISELESALSQITSSSGAKIDILGFDACLMGMIEVDYQLGSYANFRVGSEQRVPWDGWNYNDTLTALAANPTMSPSELAKKIVQYYFSFYGTAGDQTLSAVNLTHLGPVVSAIDGLAHLLEGNLYTSSMRDAVRYCRKNSQSYYDPEFIDVYDFASRIQSNASLPSSTRTAATSLMLAINECVLAEGHGAQSQGSHGVSIYFPDWDQSYENDYDNLRFSKDTWWNEFLLQYYPTPTLTLNVSPSQVPRGAQLTLSGQLRPSRGTSEKIYLYFRALGTANWGLATTLYTNSTGYYAATAVVPPSMSPGDYQLVAFWVDLTHFSFAVSPIGSFKITP